MKDYVLKRCEENLGVKLSDLKEINFSMGSTQTYYDGKETFYYYNESTGMLTEVSKINICLPMLRKNFLINQ